MTGIGCAVIVWNNDGYGEIKDYMVAKQLPIIGVDLFTPDFVGVARAMGCHAERAGSLEQIVELVMASASLDRPTLIEIHEKDGYLDL